ncbi:hypothetical protein E2C01_002064 [Portunus trituberculatus]|uniref:Uncharacterized protein n=1 Tax=Portunus trituberculatus TaxID=210409 RepID=A0A5B7CIE2_PORTR|nr:hypothetical protein [Portunus trituberculatus]
MKCTGASLWTAEGAGRPGVGRRPPADMQEGPARRGGGHLTPLHLWLEQPRNGASLELKLSGTNYTDINKSLPSPAVCEGRRESYRLVGVASTLK